MPIDGVDYAWDRPNLEQLWAAGKRFACRYLAYLPNGKVLTAAERAALHDRGFAIVLNWEQAAGDMLRGYDVGVRHAREALRQADALGAPPATPIYFSCDLDTNVTQRLAAALYLDGCASVLGRARVGVYGEYDVIDVMVPQHAAWGWQTYAWSGGRVSGKAHLLQYRNGVTLAGADLDLDRQLQPSIGAWYPAQMIGEDDMSESWTQPLTQGTAGYAGNQRDTALAFAWQAATEARSGVARLEAAAAADEQRDNATLAAVRALAIATGLDPQPILDAIAAARAETHDLVVGLQQMLAEAQARNVHLAAALAAAGGALEAADDDLPAAG